MAKTGKSHFTEAEAAEELGLSVDSLRSLIRTHLVNSEEEITNLPAATFQRSDLLLLKFIAKRLPGSTHPD
jgi:hypothetical protein